MHGTIELEIQRLIDKYSKKSFSIFEVERVSKGLEALELYYSNIMSYNEVSKLIEKISGEKLVCKQEIQNTVVENAEKISKFKNTEANLILANKELKQPRLSETIDIYSKTETEILLFCDAIEVKKQKEHRKKNDSQDKANACVPLEGKKDVKRKTVSTNLIMLQKNDGEYEYITDLLQSEKEKNTTLLEQLKASLIQQHGNNNSELKIIAITDGARNIKNLFSGVFEKPIFQILDWYHLCKKSLELLSMASISKIEKSTHLCKIYNLLWVGKSKEAVEYLKTIKTKNQAKLDELIGYLEKHAAEIINYELRQSCGKTIGSGRVEQGVNGIVGNRQKKKGMAWSPSGSLSLAILKSQELNAS